MNYLCILKCTSLISAIRSTKWTHQIHPYFTGKSVLAGVGKVLEVIYNMGVAGASAEEAVKRLAEVVDEEKASLIMGIKDEMEELAGELTSFTAFLKQALKSQRANDNVVLKDVVDNIRKVASDGEGVMRQYILEREKYKDKGVVRFLESIAYYSRVNGVAKEIHGIRNRVAKIRRDNAQAIQALITDGTSSTTVIYYGAAVAGASVEEPINRLEQVVEENGSLLFGIKDEIQNLVAELKEFNAFLKQALKDQKQVLKDVVDNIRNLASDAEDVMGECIVEKYKHIHKGVLKRYSEKFAYYTRVSDFAKQIHAITNRITQIWLYPIPILRDTQPAPPRMAPIVEEDDVVGFDSEAEVIKDHLIRGPSDLTIISIEGMTGLGKTTLAWMVFTDRDLQYEFFTRLWVYVSITFNRRQIFLDILSNFTRNTKEFHSLSEEKLADKIKDYLMGGKYFIVVDDVWTKEDWDCLKIAFPNNYNGNRILVTTRHHNVASYVDSTGTPHKLKFLGNDESWELLEKKIFRKEKCPSSLQATGRNIAIKCNGLPLAVVVIAGVLNKYRTTTEWKQVAEDPYTIINIEDMSYYNLVKLSYDHLPYNLKDCFLYLAVFPIGHEIVAWKLICLWIAEGFIPLLERGYGSELVVTAEKYLKDLVDKNLVMVSKRRADGGIKTCRIHNTLHEFCKTEAAGKNLFYEIERGSGVDLNKMPRRICVQSSVLDFLELESMPSSKHVRSFLCCCSNEMEIPTEHLAVIPESFPLLRVMDVESLKFKLLPKQLYHLFQLRYLAVSTEQKLLPKAFSNLWNMQTLVLNTSGNSSVEVEADIWSMTKLRHVHSNTPMSLPRPPPKNRFATTHIQTLSTISPSSCTREIFDKTPDLQKLGIRGNLAELMGSKGGVVLFDNLQKLDRLENLKLINDNALQKSELPRFPPRLRKLTLSNTTFEWQHLNILGSLDELQVLKLEEDAFRGEFCDVSNTVFKQLQYLRIGRTNLVSWTVSKNSFPALKCLILRHCTALESLPSVFGEVESLMVMELYCTNKNAADSARQIHKLKNEYAEECRFQLSIYPPNH